MDHKEQQLLFGYCCGCACFILLIILISCVEFVAVNHVGIKYNSFSKQLHEDTFLEGRYLQAPFTRFAEYPTTKIPFEFANFESYPEADLNTISAWTINGQTVSIQLSFFAEFTNFDNLGQFYISFGEDDWKSYFIRLGILVIKGTTTNFDELSFYNKRADVNEYILNELNEQFYNYSYGCLNVTDVQLRSINLDNELETAVENKLIELINIKKANVTQNITVIESEIDLINAEADNNVTVIYANAYAEAAAIIAEAEAEAFKTEFEAYALAYKNLSDSVGSLLNDETAFMGFMMAELLSDLTEDE